LLIVPVVYSHGFSSPKRQNTKLRHWLQYSEKHPSIKLRVRHFNMRTLLCCIVWYQKCVL